MKIRLFSKVILLGVLFQIALFQLSNSVMAETTRLVPQSPHEMSLSFSPIVKKASPSIVNIYSSRTQTVKKRRGWLFNDPVWQRLFGDRLNQFTKREQNSLGSGVIVHKDGLVITNYHVIAGADEIKVIFANRKEYAAKPVLVDKKTDLAVLKIDSSRTNFPVLGFGNSDLLEVGDLVLAIGNPFGFKQTVTSGIVSALGRNNIGVRGSSSFIQTDASINPGNSGGALINMSGQLVGINSVIFSKNGASIGIGFAVPSVLVENFVKTALKGETFERPWFGISAETIDWEIAESLGQEYADGILIKDVYPDSPAARIDIQRNDVLHKINDNLILSVADYHFRLGTLARGGQAKLELIRNGKRKKIAIDLISAPEIPKRQAIFIKQTHPLQGAEMVNISPAVVEQLGIDLFEGNGVVISRLIKNSNAAGYLRLNTGDRIGEINGQKMENTDDIKKALSRNVKNWEIVFYRKNKRYVINVNS